MIPGPALANSKETSIFQDRAFKMGVSREESFLFKTHIQVHALETLQNLKKEFTVQQALQFTKWVQVDALWAVDTIKEALLFSNYFQLSAFREGVPIEEVLKIDKEPQAGPADNTTLEGSVVAAPFELTELPQDTQEQSDAAQSDPLKEELKTALDALEEVFGVSPEELLSQTTDAEMDLAGAAGAFDELFAQDQNIEGIVI